MLQRWKRMATALEEECARFKTAAHCIERGSPQEEGAALASAHGRAQEEGAALAAIGTMGPSLPCKATEQRLGSRDAALKLL